MTDEEPFDSMGTNAAPTVRTSSTPNAPPSYAFEHGGNITSPSTGAPPPHAFPKPAVVVDHGEEEDDLGAIPSRPQVIEPSIMSSELNDRWKQYEATMDNHRSESSLENSRSTIEPALEASRQEQPHRLPASVRTELAPRQPYSLRKSQSYDTDELIRKYGGISGVSPILTTPRHTVSNPSTLKAADVRDQAQKVLELVDDHLKTPIDVRRTESGGFRMTPTVLPTDEEDPYLLQRSASTGKRVPSALAGLNFSKPGNSWKESGRYSFKDPAFRDDDHFSDEEDNIIRSDGPFEDEPVVDVVAMESRAAGVRPYTDERKFEGDFEGGSKTWSSRYSDTAAYVSQKHILDQWDKEFEQEQSRKSARNMFMSTATEIRSSATNAWSAVEGQKQQIFGAGGFSFRSSHVFGNQRSASERNEMSLRAAWREIDDVPTGPPPVHKTWQEVMMNKRKRRRIIAILVLFIIAVIAASSTVSALKKRQNEASVFAGSNVGERVTFYVTSDTPFDQAAEDRLTKDLSNIPMDSEFVIHLGNIQDAAVSMCPKTRYGDIASVLAKSPVPLFIVPGAEDWTKCPVPDASLTQWTSAFKDFDLKFNHGLPVKRDAKNPEAFAFLHKGVLFMGLHIVSGPVVDDDDVWVTRQKEMLKFYYGIANVNKGKFRSVVLMGNARPGPQQALFFETLFSNLKEHHAPIAYFHANHKGDDVIQHNPFENRKDIQAIGVQNGNSHPPLKITVGFGERPFIVG